MTSRRVLVVEDDPDIGRLVSLQLAELSCDSHLVADGLAALGRRLDLELALFHEKASTPVLPVSDADRAMLVAVHPWDVDGAQRAGLQGAWLNRQGASYPAHFRAPDVEASDLVGLARQLG